MIHSCYDEHAIKMAVTLVLVSLYNITLAKKINNGIVFIFTSQCCKIENIKRNGLKQLTPCLGEEGIIYSVNMAIVYLTLLSFPMFTLDDYTAICTCWKKYTQFENLVTHYKQKKPFLLTKI